MMTPLTSLAIRSLFSELSISRSNCTLTMEKGFRPTMVPTNFQSVNGRQPCAKPITSQQTLVIPMVHRFEPESAHIVVIKMAKTRLVENFAGKEYPVLACQMFGKQLNNPIGLAAGFDKNGEAIGALRKSGFGFTEIGTVTPLLQVGNRRPRVFRLNDDEAVINSYGFNNDGIGVVLGRVKKASDPNSSVPLGVNLGKNKDTTDAAHDFEKGITAFSPYSDYLVVNISSPNTPVLRELHAKRELKKNMASIGGSTIISGFTGAALHAHIFTARSFSTSTDKDSIRKEVLEQYDQLIYKWVLVSMTLVVAFVGLSWALWAELANTRREMDGKFDRLDAKFEAKFESLRKDISSDIKRAFSAAKNVGIVLTGEPEEN